MGIGKHKFEQEYKEYKEYKASVVMELVFQWEDSLMSKYINMKIAEENTCCEIRSG